VSQPVEQLHRDGLGLGSVGQPGQEDRELVTAEARHHVVGADRGAQSVRHQDE
jgi:hypothetical protein